MVVLALLMVKALVQALVVVSVVALVQVLVAGRWSRW